MEHQPAHSILADPSCGDESFDRHILGRMLLHASVEANDLGQTVADRLGLSGSELRDLQEFLMVDEGVGVERTTEAEDEEVMVRALLEQNCSETSCVGHWLAAILARRALEPNHLWEDLGLATRPDLSKLLMRHFSGLASKNTRNMRWKKFLYRALCEAEGFSMCPSPTCDACAEFEICYGDESGPSALARNARQAADLA